MRKVLPAVVLIALLAGCGGTSKETSQLTKAQYAAALDKLCTKANREGGALHLTDSMVTWKESGDEVVKIVEEAVTGFKALTPPRSLRAAAERHIKARERMVSAAQDATNAAQSGDGGKFALAVRLLTNFTILSRTAASVLGATGCA